MPFEMNDDLMTDMEIHMAQIDDELDEPKVGKATTTVAIASEGSDDEDVEFGDSNVMAKTGLQKFMPGDNEVLRVALLTEVVNPKKAWSHFVTDKGSFRCLTVRDDKGNPKGDLADCCKKLNGDKRQAAQLAIAVLAFKYVNANKQGGYTVGADKSLPPIEYEIGWVKLSRDAFRRVSNLVPEEGSMTDIDIRISKKASNGVGFEYNSTQKASLFRRIPALLAEVLELTEKYKDGKLLVERLGKKIPLQEWKAILAGKAAATAADAVVGDDMSDL
jgi:hypothetical protein